MHANAFFYLHVVFIRLDEYGIRTGLSIDKRLNAIQMGRVPLKHMQSNDVWMLLPDFIVSCELQCNVILHCITSFTLEHLYLQCSSVFSLVCLLYFLVIQHIANIVSVLKLWYNVQLLSVIFKKAFQDLRWVELKIFSYKDIQYTRVELKIFTRFALKLVFRFSGRSLPWDKPPTSKSTDAHNLHVIFTCCV